MEPLHLISIVGAGPGDPELLTIKALKRIQKADVILYDALMGEDLLEQANPDCIKIYVGKLCNDNQNQKERQKEIHRQFLEYSKQQKKVVRLKAGDPMIFGRGVEEIRFCKENNLNYEVIPGITAGLAGAALFDIPLTERGKSGMTLFYTGHRKDGTFRDLEAILAVLKTGSPVVIYMGLHNIPNLAETLMQSGVEKKTYLQIVSKISQAGQQHFQTNLGDVSTLLENEEPETPSVIIIGSNSCQV
jgi:uroporphyrin-III C-methyltransferase